MDQAPSLRSTAGAALLAVDLVLELGRRRDCRAALLAADLVRARPPPRSPGATLLAADSATAMVARPVPQGDRSGRATEFATLPVTAKAFAETAGTS